MSHTTSLVDGKPILLQILNADYSGGELNSLLSDAEAVLDGLTSPVFYIADLRLITVTFNDIVEGANQASRGVRPMFHHPYVREAILVSHNPAIRLTAKGLSSPIFGSLTITFFETLDQAIAYCDRKMPIF